MPRRKPGTLLSLENDILEMALSMRRSGHAVFHGFALAQALQDETGSRLTDRPRNALQGPRPAQEFGLLTSDWEDAAAVEGRPRRRLYQLTARGAEAAERARAAHADHASGRVPRTASEPA